MKTHYLLGRWAGPALALLLTACAPSYYLTVRPSEAPDEGHDGHQRLLAEVDSVEMILSYAHQRGQELLFDAEVRNNSTRPILVDPAQFYYYPALTPAAAAPVGTPVVLQPRVAAVDPEGRLTQLAGTLSTEDRKATGMSGWEWLTIAGNLSADATAKKRKETEQQTYQRKLQYEKDMREYDNSRAQHAEAADRTARELDLWQFSLLRKALLPPGEKVRGYLVFPVLDQTAQLRVSTPIGPRPFSFEFEQQQRPY
ncbi:hypothetical protein [Hymenobacter persicinus]|uniref:Uncharacterized protein n=1 Tax=Hymenobacter persicinus TaxID=2025506 RepID=A0A4Q5L7N8_9BACT|nr:hypothetical protein [Hymenobacter persicinus]RYU77184.1 hypothetical protein EWM57_17895 [Hymenobacter persicinus]